MCRCGYVNVNVQMKMEAGGVLLTARSPSTAREDASCERRKPVTVMKMMMMTVMMMMMMVMMMMMMMMEMEMMDKTPAVGGENQSLSR